MIGRSVRPAAASLLVLVAFDLAVVASQRPVHAQGAPVQVVPLQIAPAQTPPAQVPPAPSPGGAPSGAAPSTQAGPPGPAGAPAPVQWQPRDSVDLKLLDKVNARSLSLSGRVGQSLKFGSLTIVVRACQARPPDMAADSAAFLDITDSHPDAPGFHGWMFQNEPSLSLLEHPIYDVRVTSCHS